jgi:hypothetical protein
MEDYAYELIKEDSTEVEKINVIINFLKDNSSGYCLHYDRLFIKPEKQILFNEALENTGFVNMSLGYEENKPFYSLNKEGKIMLAQHGSYLNYHQVFDFENKQQQASDAYVKSLELQLKEKGVELTTLQIKDVKNKTKFAVAGFFAGIITANAKDILDLMKKLFLKGN